MRKQNIYQPELEDWLFYAGLPIEAYATLAVSPFAARSHTCAALFCVGSAALLLLFVGIPNVWDTSAYHVFVNKQDSSDK